MKYSQAGELLDQDLEIYPQLHHHSKTYGRVCPGSGLFIHADGVLGFEHCEIPWRDHHFAVTHTFVLKREDGG